MSKRAKIVMVTVFAAIVVLWLMAQSLWEALLLLHHRPH